MDPTQKAVDFKRSIKKYFLDNLTEIEGIFTSFEMLYDVPIDGAQVPRDQWITVSFDEKDLGTVTSQVITFDLFTRHDSEGDNLSQLVDTFLSYILDNDASNGLVTIPYYDTSGSPWTVIGGIIPLLQPMRGEMLGKEDTKIKSITLLCKWGGK